MKTPYNLFAGLMFMSVSLYTNAELLQQFELENGTLIGGYSGPTTSPFDGIACYGNDDGVETDASLSGVPGEFRLDLRGASSNDSSAGISVYLSGKRIGTASFAGTEPTNVSIQFDLPEQPANSMMVVC